jgi:predicted ABC-type ATPase
MPQLYIIAGPNGAGKTTAAKTLLPDVFHCPIFINADEIAAQLNPANVEAAAFQAGRLMLGQIETCLERNEIFAIETTLATRSYLNLVKKAQLLNYEVVLIFFYLPSPEMAKERVALRVSLGGHAIPPEVIERRYVAGIQNLFYFIELVDHWFVYKNDTTLPQLTAEGELNATAKLYNLALWEQLKKV